MAAYFLGHTQHSSTPAVHLIGIVCLYFQLFTFILPIQRERERNRRGGGGEG